MGYSKVTLTVPTMGMYMLCAGWECPFFFKRKIKKSIEWFTKAINRSDVYSMKTLSRQYGKAINNKEYGIEDGFDYDYQKELYYLRLTAGIGDAEAQKPLRSAMEVGE